MVERMLGVLRLNPSTFAVLAFVVWFLVALLIALIFGVTIVGLAALF